MSRRPTGTKPSVKRTYDHLALVYDRLYYDAESRAEDQWLARRIARHIQPGDHILDVGCGTGWFLDHITVDPRTYVGLDLSHGMLTRAARKHPHQTFIHGNANTTWPITDGHYDLVVSTYCSASYAPPDHFARQAARVLRPGGRVIAMPHAHGNDVRPAHLPIEAYTPNPDDGEYYEYWRAHPTRAAFMAAGFPDVTVRGMRHPRTPVPDRAPLWLHRAWLHAEQAPVAGPGRRNPDGMTFLLVEGRLHERKN